LIPVFVHASALARQSRPDGSADTFIAQLWSADIEVAKSAKDRLTEVGQFAAPSLLAELDRITRIPYPAGHRLPGFRDGGLTARVTQDICELLGELRTAEAVPLLIRVMEWRQSSGLFEHITVEMLALAKIGRPAVAELISEIQNAEFKLTLQGALAGREGDPIGARLPRIQERAAATLGLIGDPAALPVLEQLLNMTNNGMLARTVEYEIESIRAKYAQRKH